MTLQQSSKRTFKFKLLVVFFFGEVLCSPVIFLGGIRILLPTTLRAIPVVTFLWVTKK